MALTYGHASILTNDGTYLSHHPRKAGLNQLGSKFRTYDQDRSLYGRDADFIANITLPNEAAASEFSRKYLAGEKFWGPYGNCADAAAATLNAGSLGIADLNLGPFNFVTYPSELEEEIRGIYWRNKMILRDIR